MWIRNRASEAAVHRLSESSFVECYKDLMALTADPRLPLFEPLCPRTFIYTPPTALSGHLVILCTWLGAGRKHVAKYTTLYQRTAPSARILLIEADVSILISSYEKQRAAIGPAAGVVLNALETGSLEEGVDMKCTDEHIATSDNIPGTKILLHAFSNGGTNTATQLLLALRAKRGNQPLPVRSLILDSCPAKGTYWKSYTAMVQSLPRGAATRLFGALTVHCILILLHWGWIGAMGNENPSSLHRRTLLDDGAIRGAWNEAEVDKGLGDNERTVYLYSKDDKQVDWRDIKEHAEDARKRGFHVEEIMFQGSGHCAHYLLHRERYEEIVKESWEEKARDPAASFVAAELLPGWEEGKPRGGRAGGTGDWAVLARAKL